MRKLVYDRYEIGKRFGKGSQGVVYRARDIMQGHQGTTDTFASWTIESVASAIKRCTDDPWIDRFIDRYLAFEKVAA